MLAEPSGYGNGRNVEKMIESLLACCNYTRVRAASLEDLKAKKHGLFPEPGCYAYQCRVPLEAEYHRGKGRSVVSDYVCHTPSGEYILISSKSQQTDGTAEKIMMHEILQLIETEQPAAMLVYGPMKGRDSEKGFTRHILEEIWDRTRYMGRNRVLLFRTLEKLLPWIQAGMPVGTGGNSASAIFAQYCDREP